MIKKEGRGEGDVHHVYLGLGSNLGDREDNIRQAVRLISERVGRVVRQSSLIETEPWGFESNNKFLNAVIHCETSLSPCQLLKVTQKIERDLGRKKKSSHLSSLTSHLYQDRPIDIDILLYDKLTLDEPNLKIPHPLMHEREFVMKPLEEIREND